MNGPHAGVCTCPLCCPDKWQLNAMMAMRRQFPFQSVTAQFPGQTTLEDRVLYLESKIDRLEAIIHAHVRPPSSASEGTK